MVRGNGTDYVNDTWLTEKVIWETWDISNGDSREMPHVIQTLCRFETFDIFITISK